LRTSHIEHLSSGLQAAVALARAAVVWAERPSRARSGQVAISRTPEIDFSSAPA
jgi:hypothetical protein